MRGTVFQRNPKRGASWYMKFDLPTQADGKRRTKTLRAGRTKREAEEALSKALAEIDQGTYLKPARQTVSQYLEQWLSDCARTTVGGRTFHRYSELIRLDVLPTLGQLQLQSLRGSHLQSLYNKLLESGRADGKGGLSPQTVISVHRVLHKSLEQAKRWHLISSNPVDDVDPPRAVHHEMKTWDGDQVVTALESAEGRWIYMPLLLALGTGMRAGELLGLKWDDINLSVGVLICRRAAAVADNRASTPIEFKTPKSGLSRQISLPAVLVDALKQHYKNQCQERETLGLALTNDDLVISYPDGKPMRSDGLLKRFQTFLISAGLPAITWHQLRHTHCSLLLMDGTSMKVVSERLGHSRTTVTMNTYAHIYKPMHDSAALSIGKHLQREPKNIRLEA